MKKQFTLCPACGVVGEVGTKCHFCSTIITLKEGGVSFPERIPEKRTVTVQEYAEKISIYHKIKPAEGTAGKLLIVSIGEQYGLINLNGDIIYPLGNEEIGTIYGDTMLLGHTYEYTWKEATASWDEINKEWKHNEAITTKGFTSERYFNLNTGIYADELGFVEDKENPRKLHRVDVYNGWKSINTYTNLKGKVHSYDYAEQVVSQNGNEVLDERKMYLLHHGNKCSLWILFNGLIDKNPTQPMCVLEGIQDKYTIKANNRVAQIIVRTSSGIDVPLTLAKKKSGDISWEYIRPDKIYNGWCRAIRKPEPGLKTESYKQEEKGKSISKKSLNKNVDSTDTIMKVVIGGVIILLFVVAVFLFWSWVEFEKTKYLIVAIVSVVSGIWCVKKIQD